jgi:hypothetical protein
MTDVSEIRKMKLLGTLSDKGFCNKIENKKLSLRKEKNENILLEKRKSLAGGLYSISEVRNLNEFLGNEINNQINEFLLTREILNGIIIYISNNRDIEFKDLENVFLFVIRNLELPHDDQIVIDLLKCYSEFIDIKDFPEKSLEKEKLAIFIHNQLNKDFEIFIQTLPILSNYCIKPNDMVLFKDLIDASLVRILENNSVFKNDDYCNEISLFCYNLAANPGVDNLKIFTILDKLLQTDTLIEVKSKVYNIIYKILTTDKSYYQAILDNHIILLTGMNSFVLQFINNTSIIQPCLQIIKFFQSTKNIDLITFFLEFTGINLDEYIVKTSNTSTLNEVLGIYLTMIKLNIIQGNSYFLNQIFLKYNDYKIIHTCIHCYYELIQFDIELNIEVIQKLLKYIEETNNLSAISKIVKLLKFYAEFNNENKKIILMYRQLHVEEILSRILYKNNNSHISGEIFSFFKLI